jgi:hypothetical protein
VKSLADSPPHFNAPPSKYKQAASSPVRSPDACVTGSQECVAYCGELALTVAAQVSRLHPAEFGQMA